VCQRSAHGGQKTCSAYGREPLRRGQVPGRARDKVLSQVGVEPWGAKFCGVCCLHEMPAHIRAEVTPYLWAMMPRVYPHNTMWTLVAWVSGDPHSGEVDPSSRTDTKRIIATQWSRPRISPPPTRVLWATLHLFTGKTTCQWRPATPARCSMALGFLREGTSNSPPADDTLDNLRRMPYDSTRCSEQQQRSLPQRVCSSDPADVVSEECPTCRVDFRRP